MHSEQARHLAERMAACDTIQADTRHTERPDGALATVIAFLIGAYFVIRAFC